MFEFEKKEACYYDNFDNIITVQYFHGLEIELVWCRRRNLLE